MYAYEVTTEQRDVDEQDRGQRERRIRDRVQHERQRGVSCQTEAAELVGLCESASRIFIDTDRRLQVKIDLQLALDWYRKAAMGGHAGA